MTRFVCLLALSLTVVACLSHSADSASEGDKQAAAEPAGTEAAPSMDNSRGYTYEEGEKGAEAPASRGYKDDDNFGEDESSAVEEDEDEEQDAPAGAAADKPMEPSPSPEPDPAPSAQPAPVTINSPMPKADPNVARGPQNAQQEIGGQLRGSSSFGQNHWHVSGKSGQGQGRPEDRRDRLEKVMEVAEKKMDEADLIPQFEKKEERQKAKEGKKTLALTDTGDFIDGDDKTVLGLDGISDKDGRLASGEYQLRLGKLQNGVADLKSTVFRSRSRLQLLQQGILQADDGQRWTTPPATFLPDMCYFENTYLGGSAAYLERLRRLDRALGPIGQPHRMAQMAPQAFDPPAKAAMGVTASLSHRTFKEAGRVFLQVGLRGSDRFGWRRPPLEIALVLDGAALHGDATPAVDLIRSLLRRLGPEDSLGVVMAGADGAVIVSEVRTMRELRTELVPKLDSLSVTAGGPGSVAQGMTRAGELLERLNRNRTTLPGTQIALVYTAAGQDAQAAPARTVAHGLSLSGVVTSVIERGNSAGSWWQVANAGHGNYHRAEDVDVAVATELDSLARVVSRLLRLNIKLAPGVKAIRVVGAKVLGQEEVKRVKAREVATDTKLSQTLGIDSDRGEDDDGIQTVIPYFYGGDSHVVLVELWTEKAGPVADITLKYKDMVSSTNATARTAVELRAAPRMATGMEDRVIDNLTGFEVGAALKDAAEAVAAGDQNRALSAIGRLNGGALASADRQLLERMRSLVQSGPTAHVADALRMAGERKVGGTANPQ